MQMVEIRGVREAAIVEIADPQARGDIVRVRNLAVPMCTEWQGWRKGDPARELGHESVGVVDDAADSALVKAGDRVVVMPHWGCGKCPACVSGEHIHCTSQRDILGETGSAGGKGSYMQYTLKPDYLLWKVPDDIELKYAAMAMCALGPTFTALRRMDVSAADTVVVSGCGAVGLGAIVNARTIGARVIALEFQPYRVDLARALGAEHVLDPRDPGTAARVRELTGGYGADALVETSNVEVAPPAVIELVRPRGRVAFVTWSGSIPVNRITGKGIEIYGAWHWNHMRHGAEMAQRLRLARPLLDRLMTHRMKLADVQQAFALQESGMCGKVVLEPWEAV